MTRRARRVLPPGVLVLVALAVAAAVAPTPAAWIERIYSRQAYLALQNALTRLSGVVGFAWLDVLILAVAAGLAVWWWRALRRARGERRALWRTAGRQLALTTALAAALYLVFVLAWGLNYRRVPLKDKLDYEQARVAPAAVAALAGEAVARVNRLYEPAGSRPWPELEGLPERLAPAFERVQRRLGAERTAVAGRPKATLLSLWFRRAGIDGMMNPFSLEVLVNDGVLPHERPFVLAHEWAHLAGYANESEASFVGWLTCLAGDDQSRYSGWMFLLRHLLVHLSPESRVEHWQALGAGPLEDYRAVSARIGQANPAVSRGARRVYDQFLRANRVEAGIASYGLVVDLVLGTDGTPLWRVLAR
ncbi:MAG: DUF3810 family protein [Acidobacteria bacterium]|nr:DUF3810 family protein [Acidobacteriota bacterium]